MNCLDNLLLPARLAGFSAQETNDVKERVLKLAENLQNSQKVIQLLRTLAREFHATLVVVTHDPVIAESFNNQFLMKDG
eukprot:gene7554-7385_t